MKDEGHDDDDNVNDYHSLGSNKRIKHENQSSNLDMIHSTNQGSIDSGVIDLTQDDTEMECGECLENDVKDEVVILEGDNDKISTNNQLTKEHDQITKQEYDRNALYRRHLESILCHILNRSDFSNLFTNAELAMVKTISQLPNDSISLLSRIILRKGPWFRIDETLQRYCLTKSAMDALLTSGCCNALQKTSPMDEVLQVIDSLFTSTEIFKIVQAFKCKPQTNRSEAIALLRSICKTQRPFPGAQLPIVFHFFKICPQGAFSIASHVKMILQRCFSMYTLTSFDNMLHEKILPVPELLAVFQKRSFVDYSCVIQHAIFASREHYLCYEKASTIVTKLEALVEAPPPQESILQLAMSQSLFEESFFFEFGGDFDTEALTNRLWDYLIEYQSWDTTWDSKPDFLRQYDARSPLTYSLTYCVDLLERAKNYPVAITTLRGLLERFPIARGRGRWWQRLAIDLKHIGSPDESKIAAQACLDDPQISKASAYRIDAQRRVDKSRLADDFGELPSRFVFGRKISRQTGKKCDFVSSKDDGDIYCSVETYVLEHYETEGGWSGVHCEGSVFRFLFALLLWDELFHPEIVDVFQTPFQSAPLDLVFGRGFVQNRKTLLEDAYVRIRNYSSLELVEHLEMKYRRAFGKICVGCVWDQYPLSQLQMIAAGVGGAVLSAIVERLCENYSHWSGGMPDLVMYRMKINGIPVPLMDEVNQVVDILKSGSVEFEAQIVEVKSDKDRLSCKQLGWIHHMKDAGANVFVCKVGTKSKDDDSSSSSSPVPINDERDT